MKIEDRLDRMLDQALEMTFPASDPISVYIAKVDIAEAKADRHEEVLESYPRAA